MSKKRVGILELLVCVVAIAPFLNSPAQAATWAVDNSGATGAQARLTDKTGGGQVWSHRPQSTAVTLPRASFSALAPAPGGYAGLPPTRLDSFVNEAGGYKERIYGDEGGYIQGFNPENRIDAGIMYDRDAGLTTGHQSVLPSAWGRDEFIGGPEMGRASIRYDEPAYQGGNYDPSSGEFPGGAGN